MGRKPAKDELLVWFERTKLSPLELYTYFKSKNINAYTQENLNNQYVKYCILVKRINETMADA